MKGKALSGDKIREIVKEELSEQMKEWNLSDEDIQVLDEQPTYEDIRKTGEAWEKIDTIGDIVVVAVKKAGRFVILIAMLVSLYTAIQFSSEILYPGSLTDATNLAHLIRSGGLKATERVSDEIMTFSDKWLNMAKNEYEKEVELYIDSWDKTKELLIESGTTVVSSYYIPNDIYNASIESSSSSSSASPSAEIPDDELV